MRFGEMSVSWPRTGKAARVRFLSGCGLARAEARLWELLLAVTTALRETQGVHVLVPIPPLPTRTVPWEQLLPLQPPQLT